VPRRLPALVALLLLAACRSAGPGAAPAPAADIAPWEFAPGDAPSQRLFRAQVRRASEHGSLRLVLRVWGPARFEVSASDPLGRPVWAVTVRDAQGSWSEEGGRRVCRLDPSRPVLWPRLGLTLPAADLAAVLLGRLPEAPAAGTILPGSSGSVRFLDREGQAWDLELADGRLTRWSLVGQAGALTWRREESGGRLAADAAQLEIQWREVAREPLGGTAPALPPGLDAAPECAFDALP